MREKADEVARAERARRRFESRTMRLQHEQIMREKELLEQKEKIKKAGPKAIQEIIDRSKSREGPDKGQDE
jgi:hypothetical protein